MQSQWCKKIVGKDFALESYAVLSGGPTIINLLYDW